MVAHPQKYLSMFLQFWGCPERMPDLSENKTVLHDKLGFWKNVKCTASLKPHKNLPGLCAKWTHIALDFAMSQNKWPVIFTKSTDSADGEEDCLFDMTVPFSHCVWVCYCAQMNGSPALKSKACQKVCTSIFFVVCQFQFVLSFFFNVTLLSNPTRYFIT